MMSVIFTVPGKRVNNQIRKTVAPVAVELHGSLQPPVVVDTRRGHHAGSCILSFSD